MKSQELKFIFIFGAGRIFAMREWSRQLIDNLGNGVDLELVRHHIVSTMHC